MRSFLTSMLHFTRSIFDDPLRGFRISILLLLALIAVATVMYILIERMTLIDALYMTVITVATVGFGEVHPLSPGGRVFTMVLIILGVGLATTTVGNAIGIILGPQFWLTFRKRTMERTIMELHDHYIVCGFGRMGRQVVDDLLARGEPFVIVDVKVDEEEMMEEGLNFVVGDARENDTLIEAGIQRAAGLVAALPSDADNVLTVLSARELNVKLVIVARVSQSQVESKLLRAGANSVISPYQIGGHRMSLALMHPAVSGFLDQLFTFSGETDIDIGQIVVQRDTPLVQQTVGTSDLRETHKVTILAVQPPGESLLISPGPDTPLLPGSTLVIIGPSLKIYELERRYGRQGPRQPTKVKGDVSGGPVGGQTPPPTEPPRRSE